MRNVGYIGHWILDMARLHRISVQSISYTPNEVAQETKHKEGLMRLSHFVATKRRWHKYIYDGVKKNGLMNHTFWNGFVVYEGYRGGGINLR